jgi:hypothetical protein
MCTYFELEWVAHRNEQLQHEFECIILKSGDFFSFFVLLHKHCFICSPSDSTVSEDAGIEPRTVETLALAVRRPDSQLDFIYCIILPSQTCEFFLRDKK